VGFELKTNGSFIGIVITGHPNNGGVYLAVFSFEVGT
jgi:hypothetical protein